ncbi:uncharacterized protein LOC129776190 [Toxorhynchites rutilus septentrionalis]|uniref:uncharacterized protein LOC129776190 n=1 Tax=Toxorhynchites rutilus septentrionalis TaxID=329112 RepID=UPI0024789C31|nr:uncharacterized protein LOC129776190 [Toxorhynchites rutilus septentrionalis]
MKKINMSLIQYGVVPVLILFNLQRAVGQDENVLMLPNVRSTFDDCHLRFHKLDVIGVVSPVFGHPARLKEFAHMGAIGWTQPNGNISWKCGGTLIWVNFVLTAAHCVIDSENKAPDVIRFGDLNIESTEGDEYAQQLKIVDIFRHPQHRFTSHYHDIALLKLEHNVTLTEVVAPACLWTDEEVRFKILEATGWGRTGYAEDQTPVLLKVALKPIENVECSKVYTNGTDRKLQNGLQQHQICAVDEKMDTCEGDSGGPLQIKLMHNAKVTPFVVAITSFGTACGLSAPGVYTKVAPYHDWILETMQKNGALVPNDVYNATFCALRYVSLREYEDAIIASRTPDYVGVNSDRRHMFLVDKLPSYIVQLAWNGKTNNCYGVIIDEDTVLTLAQCVTHNRERVSHIKYLNTITMKVSRIHVHPKYEQESSYNNIAILRLQHFINVNNFDPACLWQDETPSWEVHVHGSGRRDINSFWHDGSIDPSISILTPRVRFQNATSCIVPIRYLPLLRNGLTNEHICNGQNLFLVPKSCDLVTGAAVHEKVYRSSNVYPMVYGLNFLGRECGFGEHSIAIGMASHAEWMKTILFSNYRKSHDTIQFVDTDHQEGDSCHRYDGRAARCVPVSSCSRRWKQFLSNGTIELCSTSSLICCPLNDIAVTEQNVVHPQLAECPALVENLNITSPARSLVSIGWLISEGMEFRCLGTIITKNIILTTASCVGDEVPAVVQTSGSLETQKMYEVDAILVHYAFNATDDTNDIAMIRLRDTLVWRSDLFPSCLWTDTTKVPLVLSMVSPDNTNRVGLTRVVAMYNSDCQRTHMYDIQDSQLCARNPSENFTCNTMSDQLRFDSSTRVSYIVGLSTDFDKCEQSRYTVFTRISSYVHWIGINI